MSYHFYLALRQLFRYVSVYYSLFLYKFLKKFILYFKLFFCFHVELLFLSITLSDWRYSEYVSNLSNDLIIEYNSVFLGIHRFSESGNMLIIMPFMSRA